MNPFQFILILSLSLYKSIYELYLIKPFYLTENTIYVKLDPEAANTADSYYLKSGSIYSQWNYLSKSLYLLFFYQISIFFSPNDSPSRTMKNVFHFIWMFFISFISSSCSWDIQIFVIFPLPFCTFQIQKEKWKWNNLWCHELACINLQV